MRRIALGAIAVATAVVLAGCSTNHPAAFSGPATSVAPVPVAASSSAAADVASHKPLTPRIPGLFRTGVNMCGDPFAVNATTVRGTIGLLDCPGLAGMQPAPAVTVSLGGQVLISGLTRGATVSSASPAVRLSRHTFTGVRVGRAAVVIHHHACLPLGAQPQRESCPVLTIVVR